MNYYYYLTLQENYYVTSSLSSQSSWINLAILKIINKNIYRASKTIASGFKF